MRNGACLGEETGRPCRVAAKIAGAENEARLAVVGEQRSFETLADQEVLADSIGTTQKAKRCPCGKAQIENGVPPGQKLRLDGFVHETPRHFAEHLGKL